MNPTIKGLIREMALVDIRYAGLCGILYLVLMGIVAVTMDRFGMLSYIVGVFYVFGGMVMMWSIPFVFMIRAAAITSRTREGANGQKKFPGVEAAVGFLNFVVGCLFVLAFFKAVNAAPI